MMYDVGKLYYMPSMFFYHLYSVNVVVSVMKQDKFVMTGLQYIARQHFVSCTIYNIWSDNFLNSLLLILLRDRNFGNNHSCLTGC